MADFANFPTLTTERLVLREPVVDDAADVLVFRSDPIVQRYNSAPHRDLSESRTLIEEIRAVYARDAGIIWVVTLAQSGRVVGISGFDNWDTYHRRAEVGYDLARDLWGQGIATESLTAILTYGFSELELRRVEAQTIADNHASVRLLDRLGFQQEGIRRVYSREEDGLFHDGAIYGLLASELTTHVGGRRSG
ncbi:MAG: GNAT family N-acetyltransferase [Microlunatus sp.]